MGNLVGFDDDQYVVGRETGSLGHAPPGHEPFGHGQAEFRHEEWASLLHRYRPLNFAGRFPMKALQPSVLSSDSNASAIIAFS